jgi:dTDP-glucose pyrophosphorylase
VSLVLGTNIFCSDGLSAILKPAAQPRPGATIFGQQVGNLKDYGAVELPDSDGEGYPKNAIEKTVLRFLGSRTFSHGLGR